jgi:hypothetical protein
VNVVPIRSNRDYGAGLIAKRARRSDIEPRDPMKLLLALMAAGLALSARAAAASNEPDLSASVSAYRYVVPEQDDFTMLVAMADLHWLHLEGRHNYEALDTSSVFAGFDVAWGERVKLAVTPMLGVAFGALDGLIPAVRFTVDWWKLDLFTELEAVLDVGDPGAAFIYDWSELGLSPLSWLRIGVVGQRNRIIQTPLDIQRGLLVGVTFKLATITFYELNAGWTEPTYVVSLGLAF